MLFIKQYNPTSFYEVNYLNLIVVEYIIYIINILFIYYLFKFKKMFSKYFVAGCHTGWPNAADFIQFKTKSNYQYFIF